MGDREGRAPDGDTVPASRASFPTSASLLAAAGKAALVAPSAVFVSYLDARLVRASTGGLGWLFGIEFWFIVLVLARLCILGWTDDDEWVSVVVLGTLVAGLVAGPVLLWHGALAALAAVPSVFVLGILTAVIARTCGFEVERRWSHRW